MGKTANSVAEALARAHVALLADLRELEQATGSSSGKRLAELRVRLSTTRTHLAEHFRFEEQNGYMDTVREREPRLERAIHQLAEEHGELRKSLDGLIREAGDATSLGDGLQEAIRTWIECVRQHEARENDLVQDAFDLDIGPED